MNRFVIGSAGHVDHGKTTLIKALTGIDADRLAAEKQRGITIDIGFAYIDFEKSGRVGIIDVPGHENYIKNMVVGASSIDAALMVIDSSEGIKVQTLEHLDILESLGCKKGVIALTKSDLTDSETLSHVTENIRERLSSSFLKDSPIIPVSALTGFGLDNLKTALDDMIISLYKDGSPDTLPEDFDPLFMPIDRVFTIKGAGTVVTGTIHGGMIKTGGEYIIMPEGRKVTVRSLEVHDKPAEVSFSHQRTAVNLNNVKKEELHRGSILCDIGEYLRSDTLDVKITLCENSPETLKNRENLHVHYGAGMYNAVCVLVGKDELSPGQSSYARLKFKSPVTARYKDRLTLRKLNPPVTCGGALILDTNPAVSKISALDPASFEIKEYGSDKDRIFLYIEEHKKNLLRTEDGTIIDELCAEGRIIRLPDDFVISSREEAAQRERFLNLLGDFHKKNPTYTGMSMQEARNKLLGHGCERASKALLKYWICEGLLKEKSATVSLPLFVEEPVKDDEIIKSQLLDIYGKAGLRPPAFNDIRPAFAQNPRLYACLGKLYEDGLLVKLDERYIISRKAFDFAMEKLVLMVPHMEEGRFLLGDFRDRIKSSRKVALSFLEYCDRKRITIKDGDYRTLSGDYKNL